MTQKTAESLAEMLMGSPRPTITETPAALLARALTNTKSPWGFAQPISPPEPPMVWWRGLSGNRYIHSVYSIWDIPSFDKGANYVLAERKVDGTVNAKYVGKCENVMDRFSRHEKIPLAIALGANEIHLHLLANSESERFDIETDLRHSLNPPLNMQTFGSILSTRKNFFGSPL